MSEQSVDHVRRKFPTWHFPMMNDLSRNEAIENCIHDANVHGKIVFEIGTGAGLTAMLFAKHGARKVITCESDEQMYSIARRSIGRNKLSDKIDLFLGTSTEYLSRESVAIIPYIIFTETLDCGIVGEGFYKIANDIEKLNTAKIEIFPQRISQFGYMIESREIYYLNAVRGYGDIDLSDANIFSTQTYFPGLSQSF